MKIEECTDNSVKTMSEIEKWIRKLGKMEENHLPELDHKDCGILADLLYELSNTINDLTLVVDLMNTTKRNTRSCPFTPAS